MTQTSTTPARGWRFFVDRGGTFVDVLALDPANRWHQLKLLATTSAKRPAELVAIERFCDLTDVIEFRLGTTVATNALLERQGAATMFITNQGLGDVLEIGDQTRPNIFARQIEKPAVLYQTSIEASCRSDEAGEALTELDEQAIRDAIMRANDAGCKAAAICLVHGARFPDQERRIAEIARQAGIAYISTSDTAPLDKLLPRAQTVVAEAYLQEPLLHRLRPLLKALDHATVTVMASDGTLRDPRRLHATETILSGPAGGARAVASLSRAAALGKTVGLDMGGTSADVCFAAADVELTRCAEIDGLSIQRPMLQVDTIAAGGGSIITARQQRLQVGPASAGASPGPACYGRGGPATLSDANLLLGIIQPEHFPASFGAQGNARLDLAAARRALSAIAARLDIADPRKVAEGAREIAANAMAGAIRRLALKRGEEIRECSLIAFGGAGPQHACQVAEALGMRRVLIPHAAGMFSAVGIAFSRSAVVRDQSIEKKLSAQSVAEVDTHFEVLEKDIGEQLGEGGGVVRWQRTLELAHYDADFSLDLAFGSAQELAQAFSQAHQESFGYAPEDTPIIRSIRLTALGAEQKLSSLAEHVGEEDALLPVRTCYQGTEVEAEVRAFADPRDVAGPALLVGPTTTVFVAPGWRAQHTASGWMLKATGQQRRPPEMHERDPVSLELFQQRFMQIAIQMGEDLQRTARSVNVRERRDYSCALFDHNAQLIANAPHIPVHLGSMSESVAAVVRRFSEEWKDGDSYLVNDPYAGGTHLPDLTLVTPRLIDGELAYLVASRAHHADVGGSTPGSMPAKSQRIEEEGVVFSPMRAARDGALLEEPIRERLLSTRFPARDPDTNLRDLQAQLAANRRGIEETARLFENAGATRVRAYFGHVLDNGAEAVDELIRTLPKEGQACVLFDDDAQISVRVRRNEQRLIVDFAGTSSRLPNNRNAPRAVTRAAVLYVLRLLSAQPMPMNDGCLRAIDLRIPDGCLLDAQRPAAVAGGNVETSQLVCDALLLAFGAMAASQGTMNNVSFGNERTRFYETIAGGQGALPDADGASAVHTHMTNSRLTDVETLERRFSVRVERLEIRRGSGGKGRFDGGDGMIRRLRFLEPGTLSVLAGRRVQAPPGSAGGEAGATGKTLWIRGESYEELGPASVIEVEAGDAVEIHTPGGGGWGSIATG